MATKLGDSLPLDPSLPQETVISESSDASSTRVHDLASSTLNRPEQALVSEEKKQYNAVMQELVNEPVQLKSTTPPIETKEQFDKVLEQLLQKTTPPEDDVIEIDLTTGPSRESRLALAQDIFLTLSPYIAETWDAKHGEGEWESLCQKAYLAASVFFAGQNIEPENAWIVLSRLAAEMAGISPENCCPNLPGEEEHNFDSKAKLWESMKTCLLTGSALEKHPECPSQDDLEKAIAKQSSPEQQSYFQTGLSYIQSGLSCLATAATVQNVGRLVLLGAAVYAVSSIPGAAAADAFQDALSDGAPELATSTASWMFSTLSAAASAVTPYVSPVIPYVLPALPSLFASYLRKDGMTPTLVRAGGSLAASYLPAPLNIAASAAAALTFSPSPSSDPTNPPPKPPKLSITPSTAGAGLIAAGLWAAQNSGFLPTQEMLSGWEQWFTGQLPPESVQWAKQHAGDPAASFREWTKSYGPQITELANTNPIFSYLWSSATSALTAIEDHPHLAALTLAIGIALLLYKVIQPASLTASATPKQFKDYTRDAYDVPGIGTFDLVVPGPVDLKPEEEEALIKAFVSEMLKKAFEDGISMEPGDKINFSVPKDKQDTWTATVVPDPTGNRKAQKPKTHTIPYSPSNMDAHNSWTVLRKVMLEGATASIVRRDLVKIGEGAPLPLLTAASFAPVGFQSKTPQFATAMQMLLSVREIREKMKNSHHEQLRAIAEEYDERMKHPNQDKKIDIETLERSLRAPDHPSRWQSFRQHLPRAKEYPNMNSSDECIEEVFKLMEQQGDRLHDAGVGNPNLFALNLHNDGTTSETFNRRTIFPDPAIAGDPNPENREKLEEAVKRMADRFARIPEFLHLRLQDKANIPSDLTIEWDDLLDVNGNPRDGRTDENKPKYRLHSFIGKDNAFYQETTEVVGGIVRHFYWRTEPNGHPVKIDDENKFKEAAKESQNLIYLKLETGSQVPKSAILGERYDEANKRELLPDDITIKRTLGGVEAETKISFEIGLSAEKPFSTTPVPGRGISAAKVLEEDVLRTLQAARIPPGEPYATVVLPVPVAEDGNPNWPMMAVMWQVVQQFARTVPENPIGKISFVIPRNGKEENDTTDQVAEKRKQLISKIEKIQEIYDKSSNPADVDIIHNEWVAAHQPSMWQRFARTAPT